MKKVKKYTLCQKLPSQGIQTAKSNHLVLTKNWQVNPQIAFNFILNMQLSFIIYMHYVHQNVHFDPNHERNCDNAEI